LKKQKNPFDSQSLRTTEKGKKNGLRKVKRNRHIEKKGEKTKFKNAP